MARRQTSGSMKVEVTGLAEAVRDLDRFRAHMQTRLLPKLAEQADKLRPRADDLIRSRSGDLARSVVVRRNRGFIGLGSNIPYAAVQAFGGDVGHHGATHLAPSQVSGWFFKLYDAGKAVVPPAIERWVESEARKV